MPSVLITGTNRGLSLEWARQYAAEGWSLHATCRRPMEAMELLGLARRENRIRVHRLDIPRPEGSVRDMRSLVEHLTLEDTGRFFRYDGVEMPW